MGKPCLNNFSAVALIYRKDDPNKEDAGEFFLERKTHDHPMAHARDGINMIGGNWIGVSAARDGNPLGTLRREIDEELVLEREKRSGHELELLGLAENQTFAATSMSSAKIEVADRSDLAYLKAIIKAGLVPFRDFVNTVPRAVLDAADPGNQKPGFTGLASYWHVGLSEDDWSTLRRLHEKFGNLSAEASTVITSLREMIATKAKIIFGHDRPLQQFLLYRGVNRANELPLVPGIDSVEVGKPLDSYDKYLDLYDVLRRPPPPEEAAP